VPQALRAGMIDDYGWEANLVPLDTKDALVIGCADGIELMFLRAMLPEATITALDYEDVIPEARKQATGVRFLQGDMNALLASFGQEFDLISSNHTLEHLYTPNEVLTTLAGLLRNNGALISTLPMDGMEGTPFLEKVKDAAIRKTAHPLDVVYLDAGHPWKTNPADLDATMQEAGFERPLLYQRQQHLSRSIPFGERRFKAGLATGKALHTVFFVWPRSLAKVIFTKNPPRILNACLLGAERRVWFGSNLLKNIYTQEVLVLARKNSAGA
jgi:SAM-dependent methyltransferase